MLSYYLKNKICIKRILLITILILMIFLLPWGADINAPGFVGLAYASAGGGGHGGGHHAPPFFYYMHWGVLLFCSGSVGIYLKKKFFGGAHEAHHEEHHAPHEEHGGHGDDDDEGGHHGIHVVQEAKSRSALLCGLVIFLFFIAYAPSLAGYHESVPVALIKVVVMFALGVCLTIFGILGMDEH